MDLKTTFSQSKKHHFSQNKLHSSWKIKVAIQERPWCLPYRLCQEQSTNILYNKDKKGYKNKAAG